MNMPLTINSDSLIGCPALDGRILKEKADDGRLKEACQGFEEIFINMMLKEMRKGVPKGGLFPDSLQKDIYNSMFDRQIAKEISSGKGMGIAEMLYENLSASLK